MILRFSLVIFFLLTFPLKDYANENDSIVIQVFSLIYNQKFADAERMLKEKQNQLDDFYSNILKLDLYWWKYSLSRSKTDAEAFKKVLSEFDTSQTNNQKGRINQLIRSSYEMRYEVKRYNLIGAFLLRSDVRKQIEVLKPETLQLSPEQLNLFNFYVALFQYFDYAINPFSFGGKSPELLNSLLLMEKYSHDDDVILSTMAHYFLGRIDLKVENKTEQGREHFKILAERFPENTLFPAIANGTNTKF